MTVDSAQLATACETHLSPLGLTDWRALDAQETGIPADSLRFLLAFSWKRSESSAGATWIQRDSFDRPERALHRAKDEWLLLIGGDGAQFILPRSRSWWSRRPPAGLLSEALVRPGLWDALARVSPQKPVKIRLKNQDLHREICLGGVEGFAFRGLRISPETLAKRLNSRAKVQAFRVSDPKDADRVSTGPWRLMLDDRISGESFAVDFEADGVVHVSPASSPKTSRSGPGANALDDLVARLELFLLNVELLDIIHR